MSTARRRVLHHHGRRERDLIEAIGQAPQGAALQKAWLELEVVQCGYCQSGQIISAAALLKDTPKPMTTSTPPCRAMSADAAPISASALRSSTLREFEIMDGFILREQIADETAMSRRAFLQGTGLLLGFALTGASTESVFAAPASRVVENEVTGTFAPNGFIRINPTGAVTLVMPMAEMGQGVYTALSMLLAEELEVELDQIQVQHAPANDALYANPMLHIQTTGLSSSVRAFWTPLRQAGAAARMLLVAAAAKQWKVDPKPLKAQHGTVTDGKRRLAYGELVDAAAKLPAPDTATVALKDPKDFTLIGTPAKRLDTPAKVNGTAQYGIDTRLPGMKIAAIAISPVRGGSPKTVDEAAALAVKGVRQVVKT